MKKLVIILFELIFVCFLGGCAKVSGLDEQSIVYGIGVDKNEDIYEVTVQTLNTQNTSEDKAGESKQMLNISSEGKSLLEALNNIENQTGKEILYSHNIILIIGKDTADSGINNIINFFATNHKLRPTVEVFVSNIPAKELFSMENEGKQINSEDILSISMIGKEGNDAIHSNMRYLLGDLNNSYKGAKTWYIESDEEKGIICKKIAIFKEDKLNCILDEESTKGVLLIYAKAKNMSENITIDDKIISYDINKVNSKVDVKIQDNIPIFDINLDINLDLYNADDINTDSEEMKYIICDRFNSLMYNAVDICIKQNKCDIFNFNRYIMNKDLNYFKSNNNNIDEILCSSNYNFNTNVKIKYMGPNQKINSLVY